MMTLTHVLTCDVGAADADGRVEVDGASEGALVGQTDTLERKSSFVNIVHGN